MDVFKLTQIIDNINEAIIAVNENAYIVLFNKAAEKLVDISIEDVIGKPIDSIIPNTRLPIILETGKKELNKTQQIKDIKTITSRMPLLDREGKVVGAYAVFRDITQIKKMSSQLTSLEEYTHLLKSILDSTQDAISVVDENGIGIYINPAYTRVVGMTEKDIIGKPATVDIAEGESIHMQVLKTQKPVKGALLKVLPNRKQVIVDIAPIFIEGKLKGSVGIAHDITSIRELTRELEQAKQIIRKLEAKYTFEDIIGEHSSILRAVEKAKKAADTPVTVLLRGESGTGKELFAHAIHNRSSRRTNQFIKVNCAALEESLINSELFGYVEGAFTGAIKGGRQGLFEKANKGTIFLDEIGEISLETQARILRVIQEKEIIPVGGNQPIEVDVRIIAATNIDLEKAVEEKRFRKDLYYRLTVFPINIPSLSERKSDIYLLCNYLIRKCNQEYGRNVSDISIEAIQVLSEYHWPGNVRELENIIGRAIINMGTGERIIDSHHIPDLYSTNKNLIDTKSYADDYNRDVSLKKHLEESEKKYILYLLIKNNMNKTKTANELNITVRNLYYKLKKYQLM
ncbi:MAG: sigma 54-interacting transcriptional regulator [Lutisporaceae bacterium]|jgi:PAS domain S-box-containing protein